MTDDRRQMGGAAIYHGTPMTPRAALDAVLPGRAVCVSFYRPDDLEAVLAIASAVMFRQRRIQLLEAGDEAWARMGPNHSLLEALLRVAGANAVPSGPVGGDPRYPRRTFPAQRRAAEGMAVRTVQGCAALAYGWPYRSATAPVRAVRSRLLGLGRPSQAGAGRLRRVSASHGDRGRGDGQSLASAAHDARNGGGAPVSVRLRRQHVARAERAPARLARRAAVHDLWDESPMVRPQLVRGQIGGQAS